MKQPTSQQTPEDLFHLQARRSNVGGGDALELAPHMNRCYDPSEFQHIDDCQGRLFTNQADQDQRSVSRRSSSVVLFDFSKHFDDTDSIASSEQDVYQLAHGDDIAF